MINEERFWEASIAEAVSDKPPPDVTAKVLTELATTDEPKPEKRGRLRVLRWGLELAAAAAVVIGIGLATGIIKLPGGDGGDDELQPPEEVAAAPGAEYEHKDGIIELKQGWLLVTTGAPTVICEGSELSSVDGRVLIHAGSMLPGERPESVANWLKANNVETDMVNNIKHWVKGVGLAALVLSGTAMLDGQEIKAPDPQPQSTAEWHVVRSVMDIDNLPEGAKYVNADGISAAHLDFLAEVDSLEAITIREAEGIRPEHLASLKALKNLRWLDIRGAYWDRESFDRKTYLLNLTDLAALQRVGVDEAAIVQGDGIGLEIEHREDCTLSVLKELSGKGVEIDMGNWNPKELRDLEDVLQSIPTLRSIDLTGATESEMKLLAGHENLREVTLRSYLAGEIGLAYLARKANIVELSLHANRVKLDEIHQISRIKLRFLRIDATLDASPEECFAKLAGMETLRELELSELELDEAALPAFAKFSEMKTLERLRIEDDVLEEEASGLELQLGHHIPARRLEIATNYLYYWTNDDLPEFMRKGPASKHVEVISIDTAESEFYREFDSPFAEPFKAFPNLKRVELRRGSFYAPAEQDQFVRWLKSNLPGVEVIITP